MTKLTKFRIKFSPKNASNLFSLPEERDYRHKQASFRPFLSQNRPLKPPNFANFFSPRIFQASKSSSFFRFFFSYYRFSFDFISLEIKILNYATKIKVVERNSPFLIELKWEKMSHRVSHFWKLLTSRSKERSILKKKRRKKRRSDF